MGRYWSTRRAGSQGPPVATPVNSLGVPLTDLALSQDLPGGALQAIWTPLIETAPCRAYLYFSSTLVAPIEFSELIDVADGSWRFGQEGEPLQVWYVKVVTDGYDTVTSGPFTSS